jgi:hypothetical protein
VTPQHTAPALLLPAGHQRAPVIVSMTTGSPRQRRRQRSPAAADLEDDSVEVGQDAGEQPRTRPDCRAPSNPPLEGAQPVPGSCLALSQSACRRTDEQRRRNLVGRHRCRPCPARAPGACARRQSWTNSRRHRSAYADERNSPGDCSTSSMTLTRPATSHFGMTDSARPDALRLPPALRIPYMLRGRVLPGVTCGDYFSFVRHYDHRLAGGGSLACR